MIGIYRIKNKIDNKCYYGSAKDIDIRWARHKRDLNNNKHHNQHLQHAWNKYGSDNFIFEIIEECNLNVLLEREQYYLDLKPEYNIGQQSSGGDNLTNHPNKENIIKQMTESVRKRFSEMSDEERKEKHSKPMELNPNWKDGVTYNYCKCGKKIKQNATHCNKCRDRSGKQNPFFGKEHTNETRERLSEIRTGIYNGNQNMSISVDGIEYRSAGEASKKLNIPMTTIRWRVRSKSQKYKNYKYIEIVDVKE